jgi:hypothetical protein
MDNPMNKLLLPRRIPKAVEIGVKAAFARTITEADVSLFIGIT